MVKSFKEFTEDLLKENNKLKEKQIKLIESKLEKVKSSKIKVEVW